MSTQKLLLIGLALVVCLFIAGILLGQRERGNSQTVNPADLTSSPIRSLFSVPMDLQDLSAVGTTPPACLRREAKEFDIPLNRSCTFRVAGSSVPTRQLGLHLITPAVQVNVVLN